MAWLLVASYFFYMCWRWEYVALIIVQTEINYVCALNIANSRSPQRRKLLLLTALGLTLAILFFFKYFNFASRSLHSLIETFGGTARLPLLDVLLPIGISFHTFQTLSYTIDVYRDKVPVERSFTKFALFVSFFPLLVAGPIERASGLLAQLGRKTFFDVDRLSSGLKLILWGLFKKVVIADRLAEYVNQIYASPADHTGATLALATYCFAFQIYCDFSGYSDIAIGSARILGYDLMQNFRLPYLARSIGDFWQRWHISLSTWFRDYVYIPMGGSRVTFGRWAFNILTVFVLSGLWHGANWTFVIWGALHGCYYLLEKAASRPLTTFADALRLPSGVRNAFQIVIIFHLVVFAWIFFRAASLSDAVLIVARIGSDLFSPAYLGSSSVNTLLGILFILLLVGVQLMQSRGLVPLHFSQARLPVVVRWATYLALAVAISLLGKSGNDFIYFQF